VVVEYAVENAAAREILLLACEETDRRRALEAERHATPDGSPVASRLNRDIIQVTALIASLLAKLDKFVERQPRRGPGRPVKNFHWDGFDAVD
jgi:hypothetical protein